MNKVDVERHRLRIRVEVTKFSFYMGIICAVYFIIDYANSISEYNWTWIIVAVLLAYILDKKLENPVTKFYENRLKKKL